MLLPAQQLVSIKLYERSPYRGRLGEQLRPPSVRFSEISSANGAAKTAREVYYPDRANPGSLGGAAMTAKAEA
jgi:hypothetical protein